VSLCFACDMTNPATANVFVLFLFVPCTRRAPALFAGRAVPPTCMFCLTSLTPLAEENTANHCIYSFVLYSRLCWLLFSCESSVGIPIEFAIVVQRARTELEWENASLYSVVNTHQVATVRKKKKKKKKNVLAASVCCCCR
jgi:hypothetical protein